MTDLLKLRADWRSGKRNRLRQYEVTAILDALDAAERREKVWADLIAKLTRERDEARRERDEAILFRTQNELEGASAHIYALESEIIDTRRERDEARAALYCRVSSKVFCAMLSTGVCDKIDKSDHEAALTRARIEGRIEGMEKAARIYEDGLDDAGNEWDVFRDAARAIRALKDRAP